MGINSGHHYAYILVRCICERMMSYNYHAMLKQLEQIMLAAV